jgi:hypothetical protein
MNKLGLILKWSEVSCSSQKGRWDPYISIKRCQRAANALRLNQMHFLKNQDHKFILLPEKKYYLHNNKE